MNEKTDDGSNAVGAPVEAPVRPASWWKCDTHGPAVAGAWGCPECVRELRTERDGLMQTLRDEMGENLRLRALGGARQDENITAMTERLIRELEAHRLYARALCKAVDAATDFAGTVASGASWWDDVWAEHAAALDKAREQITLAGWPNAEVRRANGAGA